MILISDMYISIELKRLDFNNFINLDYFLHKGPKNNYLVLKCLLHSSTSLRSKVTTMTYIVFYASNTS